MRRRLNRAAKNLFRRLTGLEVTKARPDGWEQAKDLPAIKTLVDVGVAKGTPYLYEVFPHTHLILIDPLKECRPYVDRILSKRHGEWVEVALGDAECDREIEVQQEISKSSFLARTQFTSTGRIGSLRTVRMRKLDDVVQERPTLPQPLGLKIDTEGFELQVLRGSTETLKDTAFLIVECSVQKRFEASYEFEDMIDFTSSHGFKLRHVLSANRDRNGIIRYLDLAFTKRH